MESPMILAGGPELVKTLSSKYQIPCRVDIRGLGKAVVMIGEK